MNQVGKITTKVLADEWRMKKTLRGFDAPERELREDRNPCAVILWSERKTRGQTPNLPNAATYVARDTQDHPGRSGAVGSTEIGENVAPVLTELAEFVGSPSADRSFRCTQTTVMNAVCTTARWADSDVELSGHKARIIDASGAVTSRCGRGTAFPDARTEGAGALESV
jgi:hypothetical protein